MKYGTFFASLHDRLPANEQGQCIRKQSRCLAATNFVSKNVPCPVSLFRRAGAFSCNPHGWLGPPISLPVDYRRRVTMAAGRQKKQRCQGCLLALHRSVRRRGRGCLLCSLAMMNGQLSTNSARLDRKSVV